MVTAQPGIFAQGTRSHYHLEFDRRSEASADRLAAAVGRIRQPAVTGGNNLVIGLGADLARAVGLPGGVPEALAPMAPIAGTDGTAVPATQHDLWVWVHGTGSDATFDAARRVALALDEVATLVVDQPGFVYKDSRDLTGFVDGTANPPLHEAEAVACVGAGQAGAGGSFVLTQRWRHDLDAFEALPLADQEAVIGRTKLDDVEMAEDVKPASSHIARVEIDDPDGHEIEIFRRSTPFGTVGDHGLYFLAFSADPDRFTVMLQRMFGVGDDGIRDRLTDFTRPVTGSIYFAPSLDALNEWAG